MPTRSAMREFPWAHWFSRWEAMQGAYVAQRARRFDLLLRWPDFPRDADLRILDLGCGPGSLAFQAIKVFPRARVLAVDADESLLEMGRMMAASLTDRVTFSHVDLRDGDWWSATSGPFDLVCSATALHWLTTDHLAAVYRRIYAVLSPGGWFTNSDAIAADDSITQERYRALRQARQKAALQTPGVESWDDFWAAYQGARDQAGLTRISSDDSCWEGNDDGHPRAFHMAALAACGFERIGVIWQDLAEAVLTARKPSAC